MAVVHSRVGVAGSAVLTACLLAGGAGSAFAAPHASAHQAATHHSKPATHSKPVDRLAGPRKGAAHALSADAVRLSRISATASASGVLNAGDKAALATAEAAEGTALTAYAQAIAAASSVQSLHAALSAATRTVQGAHLQLHLVTGADRSETPLPR